MVDLKKIRKNLRLFEEVLPMGAGDRSAAELWKLDRVFRDAIVKAGGLQQPIHACSQDAYESLKKSDELAWQHVYAAIEDIAMALTGQKIEFVEEDDG